MQRNKKKPGRYTINISCR